MCRTLITIAKNPRDKQQQVTMKHLLGNQMQNAVKEGNIHGFFAESYGGTQDVRARTFSLHTWYASMLQGINGGAKSLHTHARKVSRGGLNQHGIHGWDFQGWSCSHNGTMYLKEELEKDESDSFNVFTAVFHKDNMTVEEIMEAMRKVFEEDMWVGTGTFTVMNDDYTIIASVNRDTTYNMINGNVLNIISNKDVNKELKEVLYIPYRRRVKNGVLGKMSFKGKVVHSTTRYELPEPKEFDTISNTSHNEIVAVNNKTLLVDEVVEISPGPSFVNFHEYEEEDIKST